MDLYDQTKQRYTRNACTIYTLLSVMRFNFGITVKESFIIKICNFFEENGKWIPAKGAIFSIIYKAFVNELNKRTGLYFKVVTRQISTLKTSDTNTYGIGMPRYNRELKKAMQDGVVNNLDILNTHTYEGRTFGHNLVWDGSQGGVMINTNGDNPARCSLETLKYGSKLGVFWDNIRTIEPATRFTEQVITITKQMARAEANGKLDKWLEANSGDKSEYKIKAKELFFKQR